MESVLSQSAVKNGRVTLEYLVCDGLSKDRTVEIVESFGSSAITVKSEKDRGMYDALGKGLRMATGDVVAYINAGDYYHKGAFEVVADIFDETDTQWLTGFAAGCDERSALVAFFLPYRYRRSLFDCGYYGVKLPFVQQESTFWRRSLIDLIDFERLTDFRYAGDYYLWHTFAQAHELRIVESILGVFKFHAGQLSEDKQAYYTEMRSITRPRRMSDEIVGFCDHVFWALSPKIKKKMNPTGLYRYDRFASKWR